MIIATNLCSKYDKWKNDLNVINIVNMETNSICIELKKIYGNLEDKTIQSIALAFSMYFCLLLTGDESNLEKFLQNENEDQNFVMALENYLVD